MDIIVSPAIISLSISFSFYKSNLSCSNNKKNKKRNVCLRRFTLQDQNEAREIVKMY